MKKLLFLLSLVLIFSSGCISLTKKEIVQDVDSIIDARVDVLLTEQQGELDETREELKEKLKAKYCNEDSECIKVSAPCGASNVFNKNSTDAITEYAEYTKNYNGACTHNVKTYSDPYWEDNFCTIADLTWNSVDL